MAGIEQQKSIAKSVLRNGMASELEMAHDLLRTMTGLHSLHLTFYSKSDDQSWIIALLDLRTRLSSNINFSIGRAFLVKKPGFRITLTQAPADLSGFHPVNSMTLADEVQAHIDKKWAITWDNGNLIWEDSQSKTIAVKEGSIRGPNLQMAFKSQ